MPVYNAAKYLNKAIESVLAQTVKDFTLYCINDASADNSLNILKKYEAIDPRVKIINFEENKGSGYARNYCIDNYVSAEYLCFVDADDWITEDYLETFEKGFVKYNTDSVWIKPTIINEKDQKLKLLFWNTFDDMNEGMFEITPENIYKLPVTPWNKAYKVELVKSSNAKFIVGSGFDDTEFYLEYFLYNTKAVLLCKNTYNYRRTSNSNVTKSTNIFKNSYDVFKLCLNLIDTINDKQLDKRYLPALVFFAGMYTKADLPHPMNKVMSNSFEKFLKDFEKKVPDIRMQIETV